MTQSMVTLLYDYPSDSSQLRDGSINDTLSEISGIPTCSADYTTMSIANRLLSVPEHNSQAFRYLCQE